MSDVISIMDNLHEGYYTDGLEEAFTALIEAFEVHDADCLHECLGENDAYDTAYRSMYPDEEE